MSSSYSKMFNTLYSRFLGKAIVGMTPPTLSFIYMTRNKPDYNDPSMLFTEEKFGNPALMADILIGSIRSVDNSCYETYMKSKFEQLGIPNPAYYYWNTYVQNELGYPLDPMIEDTPTSSLSKPDDPDFAHERDDQPPGKVVMKRAALKDKTLALVTSQNRQLVQSSFGQLGGVIRYAFDSSPMSAVERNCAFAEQFKKFAFDKNGKPKAGKITTLYQAYTGPVTAFNIYFLSKVCPEVAEIVKNNKGSTDLSDEGYEAVLQIMYKYFGKGAVTFTKKKDYRVIGVTSGHVSVVVDVLQEDGSTVSMSGELGRPSYIRMNDQFYHTAHAGSIDPGVINAMALEAGPIAIPNPDAETLEEAWPYLNTSGIESGGHPISSITVDAPEAGNALMALLALTGPDEYSALAGQRYLAHGSYKYASDDFGRPLFVKYDKKSKDYVRYIINSEGNEVIVEDPVLELEYLKLEKAGQEPNKKLLSAVKYSQDKAVQPGAEKIRVIAKRVPTQVGGGFACDSLAFEINRLGGVKTETIFSIFAGDTKYLATEESRRMIFQQPLMTEMQNSDGMSTRIYSATKVAEFENLFVNTVLMDQWFAKFIELTKDSTDINDIQIQAYLRSTPGHGDRIYRMPYLAPTAALFAMRYGSDVDPKSPYSQEKDMELVKKVLKENMEKETAIIKAIQKKIDNENPETVIASYFQGMLESLQEAAEVWTATETGQQPHLKNSPEPKVTSAPSQSTGNSNTKE